MTTDHLRSALELAQKRQESVLPMLRNWVLTNSYSANIDGVNAMAELFSEAFRIPGLQERRHRDQRGVDHLTWVTPGWDQQPDRRLVLIGHHDTVFPPGTFHCWELSADRLRGPGVLDMKGGWAIIHTAVWALAEINALASIPLGLISVGDEETGSVDSRPILEAFTNGAKGALVFEAGRAQDAIITQRKGTGKLSVEVTGCAVHAGNYHAQGVNAIAALAKFVTAAESLTDYDRGNTVNVGLIEGGTSANTVPAHARCTIDFRFPTLGDGETLTEDFDRAARNIGIQSSAHFVLLGGIRRPPLEESHQSADLYESYANCATKAGLGAAKAALIGGGSDANTVSAIGVPAIDGLGPRGSGFHTHDEHIEVSSLALRTNALIRFLLSW